MPVTNFDEIVLRTPLATTSLAQSSATDRGAVELATDAETITGTDAARAVTPAGLQAKVASATAKGIVELATNAESRTGTDAARALTPANVRNVLTGIKFLAFFGNNGPGSIAISGAVGGDIVLTVFPITVDLVASTPEATSFFETTISQTNAIQQSSATDLSLAMFVAVLLAVV